MNKYAFALITTLLSPLQVMASPADYVHTPNVEYGEKEIDFKVGAAKQDNQPNATASSIGLGFGATEYWFTEIYLEREREDNAGVTLAEWENKFQLTETGKYPVDLGFVVEVEAPLSNKHNPYELTMGPLFQTEFGKLQLNSNILFSRKLGPKDNDETTYNTQIGYQWQAKYRWLRAFEFGAQGFGEMGKWNSWDKSDLQNHRMGPAVFGKLDVGPKQAIKYNAAVLFGVSDAAPDHTFRMQVEYEF